MFDHVGLNVADFETSRRFLEQALSRLSTREEYHPTYDAAFVLDPDGNNIEAVCHTPL